MVSLKALENNEYSNNPKTNTDAIYSKRIKSFVNNLEEFKKYKGVDNLDWLIENHNELLQSLISYNTDKKQSSSTLESNISAMMRVICIHYDGKDNDLYKTYQNILQVLIKQNKHNEGTNKLNPTEMKKGGLIPFEVILKKQQSLQEAFNVLVQNQQTQSKNAFKLNQDLLLLSLYSLIPSARNDIKTLSFIENTPDENDTNNYIVMADGCISINYGGMKKKHTKLIINDDELPCALKNIITQSYTLYPRQHLFTSIDEFPDMSNKVVISTLNVRLGQLFKDTSYKVGVNMLRSSYITYVKNSKNLSYNDMNNTARLMRTSRECMDRNYYKIVPSCENTLIHHNKVAEVAEIAEVAKVAEIAEIKKEAYSKHLINQKKYYESHKQQILNQQKTYRTHNKFNENKRKLLYLLNNSTDYINKCRKDTLTKYKVEYIDGRYV